MPATTLTPLSSRKRRKPITARVSAAVSIEEPLYLKSLQRAKTHHDNNWSGYIRYLVKADLASAN